MAREWMDPQLFLKKAAVSKVGSPAVDPGDPDIMTVPVYSYDAEKDDGTLIEETMRLSLTELQRVYSKTLSSITQIEAMALAFGATLLELTFEEWEASK